MSLRYRSGITRGARWYSEQPYHLSMNRRTPPISDPAIDSLLVSVREAIVTVTGSSLVGLYLFGSLAIGDFDSDVSDIDLIAALADTPSERTPRNGRVASRREPADSH